MPTDPYRTLNVERGATQEEIQRSYRALARRYHPDRNPSPAASTVMARINAAYELLSEPSKRAAYDRRFQREEKSPVESVVLDAARQKLRHPDWQIQKKSPDEFVLTDGSRRVEVHLLPKVDQVSLNRCIAKAAAFCVILGFIVDSSLKAAPQGAAIIDLMHSRLVAGSFPDRKYEELFKSLFLR
jgi:DnaJ domain